MSDSLDSLIQLHEDESGERTTAAADTVREAFGAGMSAKEISQSFKFPAEQGDPNKAVASIFIAESMKTTPEKAYSVYDAMKEFMYPDMSDEDIVDALAKSKGLPEPTAGPEQREEQATEETEEFTEYKTQLDALMKQTRPVLKTLAKKTFDDEWFGRGNQREVLKETYFDALFESTDPEKDEQNKLVYISGLHLENEHSRLKYERAVYQIENDTDEESFWTRQAIHWERGLINLRGSLSSMAATYNEGLARYIEPFSQKAADRYRDRKAFFTGDMRVAHYQKDAPELWRQELNWMDGMVGALLENTPNVLVTTTATVLGTVVGGPAGGKAAMFFTMYNIERNEIYGSSIERGYSEQEANTRANIGGVINAAIELAGGGGAKYFPIKNRIKKKIGKMLLSFAGKMTKNFGKELMEELGQELTSAILSGNTPYNKDGTIDYAEAWNQMLLIVRDTAFMSAVYSSAGKGVEKVMDVAVKAQAPTQEDYNNFAKNMTNKLKDAQKDDLSTHSPEQTEPLANIKDSPRVYLKEVDNNQYELWDADTNERFSAENLDIEVEALKGYDLSKPLNMEDAKAAKTAANMFTGTDDPMTLLHRFAASRAANESLLDVYPSIANLTDVHASLGSRVASADALGAYASNLRNKVAAEMGLKEAELQIPKDLENSIKELPALIEAEDSDHEAISNKLSEVLRLGQIFGEGTQADIIRNFTRSLISQVKRTKGKPDVVTAEQAKRGPTEWVKDMTVGVTKDDFITSLTYLFGQDGLSLEMKIIGARQMSLGLYIDMQGKLIEVGESAGLTDQDRRAWSNIFHIGKDRAPKLSVTIGGKPHNITVAQLMYLNLAFQDDHMLKIMSDTGVRMGDFIVGKISEDEMFDMIDQLRDIPKANKYVDLAEEWYIQSRGEVQNLGAQDMLGHDEVTSEHFMRDARKDRDSQLNIQDIFAAVTEDMGSAANYAAIKPLMREIGMITHNEELVKSIQKAGKTKHLKRFKQEMEAMGKSDVKQQGDVERVITKIGSNAARAILTNLRIAALQAGSIQLYTTEASAKYMRPAHIPQELLDSWELYQYRMMKLGSIHASASEGTVKKSLTGKSSMMDAGLSAMHAVDLKIVKGALRIAYLEASAKNMTGKSRRWWKSYGVDNPAALMKSDPEAFAKAVHDRASYLAYATQPMFFPESRNYYSTRDEVYLKELARFRAFTDQLLRVQARQIELAKQGAISKREAAANVAVSQAFASVWYNGLKYAIGAAWLGVLGKEQKEIKEMFLDMVLQPLAMVPFIGWPLTTGAKSLITDGYGPAPFSNLVADRLTHSAKSIYKLFQAGKFAINDEKDSKGQWKSEKYLKEGMRMAAEDALVLNGLPKWLIDLVPEEKAKKTTGGKHKGSGL